MCARLSVACTLRLEHGCLCLLLFKALCVPQPAEWLVCTAFRCNAFFLRRVLLLFIPSFQFAGGYVLLLVSAWFVDIFIMTVRVLLYMRRRFSRGSADGTEGRGAQENKKFSLPLLAFPLMWLIVFVILVTVASVQGSRDPVTKTVEVRMWTYSRTSSRKEIYWET